MGGCKGGIKVRTCTGYVCVGVSVEERGRTPTWYMCG